MTITILTSFHSSLQKAAWEAVHLLDNQCYPTAAKRLENAIADDPAPGLYAALERAAIRFELIALGNSEETASPKVGAREARAELAKAQKE